MTSDLWFDFFVSCLYPIITAIQLIPWIIENCPFIGFRARDMLCLSFPLLYLATSTTAVFIAWRRKFYKYDLFGVTDASSAFCGCFVMWMYFFPIFVINWWLLANSKVGFRIAKTRERKRRHFYPIRELTKAIPTATLVAAVGFGAFFNNFYLMALYIGGPAYFDVEWKQPNRTRASALAFRLREYAEAQQEFWQRNSSSVEGDLDGRTGYCDNFRNLYYGKDGQGRQLALIDKRLADAFAGETGGSAVIGPRQGKPESLYDYFFLDDPYLAANKLWDEEYGLVAYPRHPGISGPALLWVGMGGRMLFLSTPKAGAFTLLTPEQSPLHPECREKWERFDLRKSREMWP